VDIGHDVPRIAGRAQVAPDELVQPEPFGAAQLDGAVDRPVAGDAASGSWPSARSFVTSFDPIRPVPPITTIFI
jgi:hypothetical protein